MKDSYSPTPLKLESLKEDLKETVPRQFYPFFADKRKEESEIGSEKSESIDWEERIRRTFEEAYAQGEKAGYEMGMKKVEPLIKRMNTYIEAIEMFKEEMRKRAEALTLELSLIISEAIVLKECSRERETLLRMIKKALDLCEKKSEIIIRVRVDDAQHIASGLPSIKVIPDETLTEPGFIIESNFGEIDGTIRTQLEEIKKEILNYWQE